MEILQDIIIVNKQTIKKTFHSLTKNWMIIFTGILYFIMNVVIYNIIFNIFRGAFSIIAGIIAAVMIAAMISHYLYLLSNIIDYDRLILHDFKDGFGFFFRKVYRVTFIAWIGSYFVSALGGMLGPSSYVLDSIINILILILLNALPEIIYLESLDSMDSIMYSLDFIKNNWYNWLIPNVILYFGLYLITGNIITDLFTTNISFGIIFGRFNIIRYFVGQILFSFMMIYRGHLFKLLNKSNRRKRLFMSKF